VESAHCPGQRHVPAASSTSEQFSAPWPTWTQTEYLNSELGALSAEWYCFDGLCVSHRCASKRKMAQAAISKSHCLVSLACPCWGAKPRSLPEQLCQSTLMRPPRGRWDLLRATPAVVTGSCHCRPSGRKTSSQLQDVGNLVLGPRGAGGDASGGQGSRSCSSWPRGQEYRARSTSYSPPEGVFRSDSAMA